MKPVALTNTPNAILWELPPGKPDRREPFGGYETPDKRTRVIQSAQKGRICSYYALLPLRVRIGPIHPLTAREDRSIEKTISLWRKQMSAYDALHCISDDFSSDYYVGINQYDENLLRAFDINPLHMITGIVDLSLMWNTSTASEKAEMMELAQSKWDEQSPRSKRAYLRDFVRHTLIVKYQLQPSSWTPYQSIDTLIQTLKNEGPMAVGGTLGLPSYKATALCSARKIASHSIYYFPKGAERKKNGLGHVIVLIGAEKIGDQELVYYNDPNDISDPIIGKKIYTQSYKTFTSSIDKPIMAKGAVYTRGFLRETPIAYGIHAHPTLQPSTAAAISSMPSLGAVLSKMLMPPYTKTPPPSLSLPSMDKFIDKLIALKILRLEDRDSEEKISTATDIFIKMCEDAGLTDLPK
jgi:hypothetical protein